MASPAEPQQHCVRFGVFELDLRTRELRSKRRKLLLQEQAFLVLTLLLDRPHQLVTRDELMKRIWSSDTFVDFDGSLNKAVNRLRDALGDSAEHPRFIETLPRQGYRFIAGITNGNHIDSSAVAETGSSGRVYKWPGHSATAATHTNGQAVTASSSQLPRAPRKPKYVFAIVGIALLVLAVGFGVYRWLSRSPRVDFESMRITRLTDTGTAEGVAANSPDGRYVAYALREGEKESLWLRLVPTRSDVRILQPETGSFHGLTFSLDGNYIYFVRSDENNTNFSYLYVMPVLGGSPQRLITDIDTAVSFSPDGHQFVFERGIPTRGIVEVRVANTDGSAERVLATFVYNDVQPGATWSPDGRTIAVPHLSSANQLRWALDVVSVVDGSTRELYSSEGIGRPVWLPGGNTLLAPLYDSDSRRWQLWTISYPRGEARRLTNDLADYGLSLDLTRDGRSLAATETTIISNVWVAPAADVSTGQLITSGEQALVQVGAAAGGRVFALSWDDQLSIMNADGSQRKRFSDVFAGDIPALCSGFALFDGWRGANSSLIRVDAEGTHATKLASGRMWSPTCSPEGKFVFYIDLGQHPEQIWRIPLEGGTPVKTADLQGAIMGNLQISPDGKLLAYSYVQDVPTPASKLAVIPVSGGPPVKVFQAPGAIGKPAAGTVWVRWSADGRSLLYLLTQNGTTNIWEQPLTGGEPKQFTKFTSGLIFDFDWSPDRTRLLLARGSVSSDVVLISNLR
jgi:DNA-binding winged helix-turn-helix (wHTH) protein/Tol biopolymer transport system component